MWGVCVRSWKSQTVWHPQVRPWPKLRLRATWLCSSRRSRGSTASCRTRWWSARDSAERGMTVKEETRRAFRCLSSRSLSLFWISLKQEVIVFLSQQRWEVVLFGVLPINQKPFLFSCRFWPMLRTSNQRGQTEKGLRVKSLTFKMKLGDFNCKYAHRQVSLKKASLKEWNSWKDNYTFLNGKARLV